MRVLERVRRWWRKRCAGWKACATDHTRPAIPATCLQPLGHPGQEVSRRPSWPTGLLPAGRLQQADAPVAGSSFPCTVCGGEIGGQWIMVAHIAGQGGAMHPACAYGYAHFANFRLPWGLLVGLAVPLEGGR